MIFPGDTRVLWLSTESAVWQYELATSQFTPHPDLGELKHVKSLSYNPITGATSYIMASDENWWAYYMRYAGSGKVVHFPGERLYKTRWLYSE